jgi:hypothetical protein
MHRSGVGAQHPSECGKAYLKELFLSATMRWISTPEHGAMDTVIQEQADMLRDQMSSIVVLPSDPGYGFGPHFGGYHTHHHGMGPAHMAPHVHVPGPRDIPL